MQTIEEYTTNFNRCRTDEQREAVAKYLTMVKKKDAKQT